MADLDLADHGEKRPADEVPSWQGYSRKRQRTASVGPDAAKDTAGRTEFEQTLRCFGADALRDPEGATSAGETINGLPAAAGVPEQIDQTGDDEDGPNSFTSPVQVAVQPQPGSLPAQPPPPGARPIEERVPLYSDCNGLSSLKMANKDRTYRLFPGADGKMESTLGALIPDGYTLCDLDRRNPWICPIRSCRRIFPSRAALGGHFNKHRQTLLNDNLDSTFSIVGLYPKFARIVGESGITAVVISRNRGDPNEPLAPICRHPGTIVPGGESGWPAQSSRAQTSEATPPSGASTTERQIPPSSSASSTADRTADLSKNENTPLATRAAAAQAAVQAAIQAVGEPELATAASWATVGGRAADFERPIEGNPLLMWEYIKPFLRQTPKPPTTGYVPQVIGLPRKRDIRWNHEWKNSYFESFPRDVTALIMHLTGDYPEHPCSRCEQKKGPFHGCIIMSAQATDHNIISCSNCWYHGYQSHCSLQPVLRARLAGTSTVQDVDHGLLSQPLEQSSSSGPNSRPARSSSTRGAAHLTGSVRPTTTTSFRYPEDTTPPLVTSDLGTPGSERPEGESRASTRASSGAAFIPPPFTAAISTQKSPQDMASAEALEMEEWEVGPGSVPSQGRKSDNIAFSNAYLSTNTSVAVADGISFRVEIVRPGANRFFEKERDTTRICSLASGKLRIKMQNEPELSIGPHGMFKIPPGVECTAENRVYLDCILHVSSIVTEEI